MSFGCPVVTTSGNGNEEIIDDGIDGFVIQPGDTRILAEKISSVLTDDLILHKISTAASRKIATNFTWEKIVERFDIIVRDIIGSSHKL